jgi:prolyl-tRNA synthetase
LTVGARGLKDGQVELKLRAGGDIEMLPVASAAG